MGQQTSTKFFDLMLPDKYGEICIKKSDENIEGMNISIG